MTQYDCITYSRTGAIVRIALNRPRAANSIDDIMARELAAAAAQCDSDHTVKAVVLTGTGSFLCAGGDLKRMLGGEGSVGAYVKRLADDVHRAIATFARMDPPLIVAVNGIAAGGGFSLAMAGDLVVAAESASFTMAYTSSP